MAINPEALATVDVVPGTSTTTIAVMLTGDAFMSEEILVNAVRGL